MSSSGKTSQALRSIGASYRRNSVFTVKFLHECVILKQGTPLATSGSQPRKGFGVIATGMFVVLCGLMMIFPGDLSIATAQPEVSDEIEPWMAMITKEKVTARCGLAEQFYAVGSLHQGDIVRVIGLNNESGWAKVNSTVGLSGFINAKDVKLSDDGKNATVLSDCFGLYPANNDPKQSWKRIQFKEGTTMPVITILKEESGSFVKVRLPSYVPVSVPIASLRRATDQEITAWSKRKNDKTMPKKLTTPPSTSQADTDNTAKTTTTPEVQAKPNAKPDTSNDENEIPKSNNNTQQKLNNSPSTQAKANKSSTDEKVKTPDVNNDNNASNNTNENTASENAAETKALEKNTVPIPLSLNDLEGLYEQLKKTPILEAEIEPIMEGYRKVAADPMETTTHRRLAEVRVRLLAIRLQTQHARQRMEAALNEADFSIAKSQVERESLLDSDLLRSGLHGRLTLSNVFDGKRLPMLYRLRDMITGRTMVYVRSDKMDELRPITGQIVTLIGNRVMDPVLGVSVLDKARVMNGDE